MTSSSTTTTPTSILSGVQATLGLELLHQIQHSKILLVGAGGIGCELLKNLALTGFRHVQVIDLDTIDVSNLNRQLLFRTQHVGQPKCTVAAHVATQMAACVVDTTCTNANTNTPPLAYTAHHGNVCDNAFFNAPFIQPFDLVLNALDNVVARRRVNRLCLATGVPLIEAGTTGYLGQVNVIHKPSHVACYECVTQEPPKVYPICTIRSTPSMPVHTIVWAKELYKLLFGVKVEESMLYEDMTSAGESTYMPAVLEFRACFETAKQQQQQQQQESSGEDTTKEAATTTTTTTDQAAVVMAQTHAQAILTHLYVTEIKKQLDMDRYKTARKTPVVLSTDAIATCTRVSAAPTLQPGYRPTDTWSSHECVAEFTACLYEALVDPVAVLPVFDKDDAVGMRLVTAASNLRSGLFDIQPLQSYYAAKGIAGNIIPAIATTNAICAGLQILQVFHILRAQLEHATQKPNSNDPTTTTTACTALNTLNTYCSYINCLRNATRNGLYIAASRLEKPNPHCFVCRNASIPIQLTVAHWTLQDFLAKILKADLGFEQPTLLLDGGDCIWEEGQDADSEVFLPNLIKALPDLPCGGIRHGTVVTIEDFSQDLTVDLAVTNVDVWPVVDNDGTAGDGDEAPDDAHKFIIGGSKPVPVVSRTTDAPATDGNTVQKSSDAKKKDDDDFIEIVQDDQPPAENGHKRVAENGEDGPPVKKTKALTTTNGNNNNNKSNNENARNVEVIELD